MLRPPADEPAHTRWASLLQLRAPYKLLYTLRLLRLLLPSATPQASWRPSHAERGALRRDFIATGGLRHLCALLTSAASPDAPSLVDSLQDPATSAVMRHVNPPRDSKPSHAWSGLSSHSRAVQPLWCSRRCCLARTPQRAPRPQVAAQVAQILAIFHCAAQSATSPTSREVSPSTVTSPPDEDEEGALPRAPAWLSSREEVGHVLHSGRHVWPSDSRRASRVYSLLLPSLLRLALLLAAPPPV